MAKTVIRFTITRMRTMLLWKCLTNRALKTIRLLQLILNINLSIQILTSQENFCNNKY